MKFYLGTHMEGWLQKDTDIPLFISYRRLRRKKNFTKAKMSWALDSGGFSELSLYGEWTISPQQYLQDVEIYNKEIGNLDWAAIQDYMCEPHILQKTKLGIKQHQLLTCMSYMWLKSKSDINFIPILQGWELDDYLHHRDLYYKFGVDLTTSQTTGVGSVCRRQGTNEIGQIMSRLHTEGISIHGFGVKMQGIEKYGKYLTSSDSLAWSINARYEDPLEECTHSNCANCFIYATQWRDKILKKINLQISRI